MSEDKRVKEVLISESKEVDDKNGKSKANNGRRKDSVSSVGSDQSIENLIPTPPDGGWGWVVVFASLCNNIIVDGIAYSFGIFMPEFVHYFGESRSKVALIGSLLCGTYLCTGPIVSGLTNKFGCRPVAIAGSIIGTIAFILARFSPNINILILTYGIMGGFGFGMIYLPSIVSVGYYFEKKRALATGIAVCGSGVGTFIFAPLSRFLLDQFDWKNAIFIIAGLVLNGCVFSALMRPLEPTKKPRDPEVPREKNMMDRLKEEARAKRKIQKGITSESSGIGPTDTTDFLEKVKMAKLNREKMIQETDSDIGSLPSTYFVKDKGGNMVQRQDSRLSGELRPTIQKLSFSDRGENESLRSPSRTPRITLTEDGNEFDTGSVGPVSQQDSTPGTSPVHSAKSPQKDEFPESPSMRTSTTSQDSRKQNKITLTNGVQCIEIDPSESHRRNVAKELLSRGGASHAGGSKALISGSMRSISDKDYKRPMYRKDIFYSGSIRNINEYKSQPEMTSYITSITSIPGDQGDGDTRGESFCHRMCPCLPKPVVDILSEMLDFSLLTNAGFMFICLGNVFAMIGFYVPYVFLVDRAILLGVEQTRASLLLSVIGITNTIGRVLSGLLADRPWMNSLMLNNVSMLVAGVAMVLTPFCTTFPTLVLAALMFGLMTSAFISLTSIILVDLLGLGKLTNAFGLLSMGRGIAAVVGPPMAGAMFAATGNYDMSFYLGGALFLLGTAMHFLLFLPCLKNKEKKYTVSTGKDNEMTTMMPKA
ncbi:monocarboxylate transporter 14-like isoform X2 [Dreissena polymorpha]|uniref:monocarboxylate transporter 14-like isoform X2 n=1 Tax=Dreissena polymorpha TaxID=45954 RepID=UPI0022654E39|nr:monocarboxylate transporter 14-like isoform X2 [Dreissena polymorpha]